MRCEKYTQNDWQQMHRPDEHKRELNDDKAIGGRL